MIYRYQSANSGCGYDISISRILWYRMIWDIISRYITIYYAISHRVASKHQTNTTELQRKPTTSVRSTICFGFSSLPSSRFVFRLAFFCCPSVVHQLEDTSSIIGLPVPPAHINLVPLELGLLPERMHLFHSKNCYFSYCFFRSLSFFFVDTWHSLVFTRYLVHRC